MQKCVKQSGDVVYKLLVLDEMGLPTYWAGQWFSYGSEFDASKLRSRAGPCI